jgi:tRNA A37 methylthiotransferase MiaB
MESRRPRVLLVQLPIPPPGPQPVRGNVPLAAGYLKLFALRAGLDPRWAIDLLPPAECNTLGDEGLVEAILARGPRLVGLTCYLWNVDRALWIAGRIRSRQPDVQVVVGGPEVTADNRRLLEHPAVDYAVIGEGEATFAELLESLAAGGGPGRPIDGLWDCRGGRDASFRPRRPLESLDAVCSPYLEGILDAAEERTVYLETVRGCVFRCKFCYYPKSYTHLHYLSEWALADVLAEAARRGAEEVVLLDPTLNQRRDFEGFCRRLGELNPQRQLRFFGELRAEGITDRSARLLAEAPFTEVEVGLQAIDGRVQDLMGRKNRLAAFERGMAAMLDAGIRVKVDLILGLPGDTPDSVRRSIDYLRQSRLYSSVQVFNLSILPGTAFREEAGQLGLEYQPAPPYYVLNSPTLRLDELFALIEEAQQAFGTEFDAPGPPVLDFPQAGGGPIRRWIADLDGPVAPLPPAAGRAQAFTLWLRSADFDARWETAAALARTLLDDNPHTTLQVVLEPAGRLDALGGPVLPSLLRACYQTNNYLDRFYSLHPGELWGSKRLVVLAPADRRRDCTADLVRRIGRFAVLAWRGAGLDPEDLDECEVLLDPPRPGP